MLKRSSVILSLLISIALGVCLIAIGARAAGDLTPKEARRLIAHLAGIQLPSDAVRIKDISALGDSAVVVAQVETAFRLLKGDNNQWRVVEIRTGDRRWEDVDMLVRALNAEKAARARAELESIAIALESYRRDHGFYVQSKSETVLIDHLSPHYLTRVMRLDPWHQPYEYEGARNSFLLRSVGPDGKSGTVDDLIVANVPR